MKLVTLAKKHNYTCYWCKKKFLLEDLSRDHIFPSGHPNRGVHRQQGEMVLACVWCNNERGNLPFNVFQHKEVKPEVNQYKCPSYYNEDNVLVNCNCGKCA